MKREQLGILFGASSGFLWGLSGIFLATILCARPAPLIVACLHDGFATLWLSIFLFISKRNPLSLPLGPCCIVACAALLGGPVAMSGYLLGIHYSGVSFAAAITACYPAFGALFAWIFLGQKLSQRAFIGMILTISGASILGLARTSVQENYPLFTEGLLLSLLSAIMWGLEGVIATYAMGRLETTVAACLRQGVSFFTYLLFVVPCIEGYQQFTVTLSSKWGLLISCTALVGALSYRSWYAAMSYSSVALGMSLNITYALWSIILSSTIMDVQITPPILFGALLITFGTILIVCSSHPRTTKCSSSNAKTFLQEAS